MAVTTQDLVARAALIRSQAQAEASKSAKATEAAFAELRSASAYSEKAILFIVAALALLTGATFTGLIYLDNKLERKSDYMNSRIDGLRVEFGPDVAKNNLKVIQ